MKKRLQKPVPISPLYTRAGTGLFSTDTKENRKYQAEAPAEPQQQSSIRRPIAEMLRLCGLSTEDLSWSVRKGRAGCRRSGTSNILTAPSAFSRPGQPETWPRPRQKPRFLRQAIADADWDTVERHGGLAAVVEKIDQADEETAASGGAGWFRQFPPPGVAPMPSYGWPPYKGRVAHAGGARF